MRFLFWLFVVSVLANAQVQSHSAEPRQQPQTQPHGFASPVEAWETYVNAVEANDWATVFGCCTPAAQDAMTFDYLLGLKFNVAWFSLDKSDDKQVKALAEKCDRLYARHGIEFNRLEKEAEKADKADMDRDDLQNLCLPMVRDKRAFFIDAAALAVEIQATVAKKLGKTMEGKSQPEEKAEAAELPPPDLDKLVKVKVHGDRATGQITHRLSESTTLIVAGKRIRFQTETKSFRRIDGGWYVAADKAEPVDSPLHTIAESQIPFEKQFSMEAGDALRFELPGGKIVAVWCEGGLQGLWAAEQTTDSGLKTCWGEVPFKHVGYKKVRKSRGSMELGETNSYIKQGAVITDTGKGTSTYQLFVAEWEFNIIEDLRAKGNLPITIRVTKRTAQ